MSLLTVKYWFWWLCFSHFVSATKMDPLTTTVVTDICLLQDTQKKTILQQMSKEDIFAENHAWARHFYVQIMKVQTVIWYKANHLFIWVSKHKAYTSLPVACTTVPTLDWLSISGHLNIMIQENKILHHNNNKIIKSIHSGKYKTHINHWCLYPAELAMLAFLCKQWVFSLLLVHHQLFFVYIGHMTSLSQCTTSLR